MSNITTAQRDAEAARLRSKGMSYRDIANEMNCNVASSHRAVQRALARIPLEAVGDLRKIEGERLENLWLVASEIALNGSNADRQLRAVDRCLTIMERKAKLFGLDAPTKNVVSVITEDVIDAEIARLETEIAQLEKT